MEANSFGYTLRQTSRKPLYLPPLYWGSHHVKVLRISIVGIVSLTTAQPPHQIIPSALGRPQPRAKRLPVGSVDPDSLKVYLSESVNGKCFADNWLFKLITQTIENIQKDMPKKPFQIRMEVTQQPLTFSFSSVMIPLQPEIVISTKDTEIPFLIYSGNGHKHSLRARLANERRVTSQFWRILHKISLTKFDIDPFDVACLIAMGQEQQRRFSSCGFSEAPGIFTVYLITPHHYSAFMFYLFTARIPESYLDAIHNIELKVTEGVTIAREVIKIPQRDTEEGKLGQGGLVEKIGEILEEAFCFHQAIKVYQAKEEEEWIADIANLSTQSLEEDFLFREDF